MKVNELRIGNLVYAFKGIWQVDNTCFNNIELMETYIPIPLTEEWLVKFGFEDWDFYDINEYETEKVFALFNIIDGSGTFKVCKNYSWYGIKEQTKEEKDKYTVIDWIVKIDHDTIYTYYDFKYVHQLQNLYFALTGNELTIK